MGVRLYFLVEGQTEEAFVKEVLKEHLATFDVWVFSPRMIQTGKTASRLHKGGHVSFEHLKGDLVRWAKEDRDPNVRFTTMVDLYKLPRNVPGYDEALSLAPYQRIAMLEQQIATAVGSDRLIPYIQLHEFETLLYADITKWDKGLTASARAIERLEESVRGFPNIEFIDDGENTAPSKRILQVFPHYEKVVMGPPLARDIGLDAMRKKCRHFNEWLSRLESLGDASRSLE